MDAMPHVAAANALLNEESMVSADNERRLLISPHDDAATIEARGPMSPLDNDINFEKAMFPPIEHSTARVVQVEAWQDNLPDVGDMLDNN